MKYGEFKQETTAETVADFKKKIKEAQSFPQNDFMESYIATMHMGLKHFEKKLLQERLEKIK